MLRFAVEIEAQTPPTIGQELAGGRVVAVRALACDDSAKVAQLTGGLTALLAYAKPGSAEEKIIAFNLGTTPEALRAEHLERMTAQ